TLERPQFANGPSTFVGEIHSKVAGRFGINGFVVPFVAPMPAFEIFDELPKLPSQDPARQPKGEPKYKYDGDTVIRTWPDGTRQVTRKDGRIVMTWPDGTEEVSEKDGKVVVTRPDGVREEITEKSWTATWTAPDGTKFQKYKDGTLVVMAGDSWQLVIL